MEFIAVCLALGLSLLGHLAQFAYLRYFKRVAFDGTSKAVADALAEQSKKRTLSVEASELLQDLYGQGAVLRVQRMDTDNLFMWRPR